MYQFINAIIFNSRLLLTFGSALLTIDLTVASEVFQETLAQSPNNSANIEVGNINISNIENGTYVIDEPVNVSIVQNSLALTDKA
ncbi:MAG TPA: hypothetical protein VD815_10015 [Candidatus Saccharimonadales bacterium]|nr:hypothetical protein [Candidatus Saccharimonadales bacterium]